MKVMLIVLAWLLCGVVTHQEALAQTYPTRPIRLIVPFAPGGGTDIVARLLTQKLAPAFKQSVIVDNRAGGGGITGTEIAVHAKADGYTFIMVSGSYAANAALFKLAYDPVNDIVPIALIGETPYLLTLHPGVPVKSVQELIALAKDQPKLLNYGSSGAGSITHLATELFDMMANIKMTHVSYRGLGPATNAILGGEIQLILGSTTVMPHVRANRLRAIAVTTSKRSSTMPDLPTVAEAGVPGYEVALWFGVMGPKGLQKQIVTRWNAEIRSAVKLPDIQARLVAESFDTPDGPPELFQNIVKRDIEKWRKVVKEANIQAQ